MSASVQRIKIKTQKTLEMNAFQWELGRYKAMCKTAFFKATNTEKDNYSE